MSRDDAEAGDRQPDDAESEWRFAVDDVGPDGVVEETRTPERKPIEAGSIDLEHAVFVSLGVVLTVSVLVFGF